VSLEGQQSQTTLRDYKTRLLRVLIHIQAHLDTDLGLEELARVACFSPYHFHRVFTGMLGESVKDHVRRLRLERAAVDLKHSKLSVTEIALNAGYATPEAFTRSFKAGYGLSPSAYRLRKSPRTILATRSNIHYQKPGMLLNFKEASAKNEAMNVQMKNISAMRVAFMRHVGPYSEVGEVWDKFLPRMGKDGFLGGDTLFLGICHDDPDVTPQHKIRYDACVTVDGNFVPGGDIGVQTVHGGPYAVATHFGPYNRLGVTYSKLFGEWLPRSGRELASFPCFEVYLNSPEDTEPEDLLTDIHIPLQPARNAKGKS
jgi:AraC family transcriptional regulator